MTGPSTGSGYVPAGTMSPKSQQEMAEKLKSLKRRFDELEEECGSDGNRSNERNVRMRAEQDHLRTEITEIEQRIQLSPKTNVHLDRTNQVLKDTVARRTEGNGRAVTNGNTLESLSHAATSPRVRTAGQSNMTGQPNSPNQTRSHASGGVLQAKEMVAGHNSCQTLNGTSTQISPRASQRIATRRSQRQAGGSSSIAAVAAAAAQAETSIQPASLPTHQDVQMTDNPTTYKDTNSAPLVNATAPLTILPGQANSFTNFGHAPSMESIVRVAEAAVAAQNAARLAAARASQPNTTADPNLDPSLFAESSNPSFSEPDVPNSDTDANTAPVLDTASINDKASSSTSAPSPTSTTSASSLSNNPYLALATNYQRGGATSPTGHPMLFPYPLFYPASGTPVTSGTPTAYPVPYNPYYYVPPHMVSASNGMYAPSPSFAPQAQPAPPQQVPQQKTPPQTDQQRGVKPKRLKSHTVTTKSFSIPMVPRDKQGKPMLPLNVGIMTVISLGTVCMRDHFHTERYIFPVGYEVTRRYLSTLDPNVEVVYHCTILDGGDGPKFQIIPSDRPDKPIIAGTATGAWSSIVKQANAIRNRQHSNSVSGPDFFGLGQNTIKHLIQELPNADKLRDYVWQNFVEGGPLGGRHAAVIPALPEEYDASLPIGAYYPRRNDAADPGLPRGLSYYPQHIIAQAEAQKVAKAVPEAIAGSSGTGSISAPPASNGSQLLAAPAIGATPQQRTVSGGSRLVIQEYQPPQQYVHSIPTPSVAQAPQDALPQTPKRITRSSTAAANANATASTSANVSAASARHTRSASKGQQNQRHAQQQPLKHLSAPVATPTFDVDATPSMTLADIMKAYPGPPLTSPTSASIGPASTGRAGS